MRRAIKRLADWVIALALLILLSPLLLLLALLVRVADGAPVLHREPRLGRRGESFELIKFRSMSRTDGASVAPADDERITGLGRVLRRTRLDELPQLFLVLAGRMSLVGPRPLPPGHAATLKAESLTRLLSVAPGITGASAVKFLGDDAALSGHDDAQAVYLARVLPAKIAADLDYLRAWNLRLDIRLAALTVLRLWSPSARRQSRHMVDRLLNDPHGRDSAQSRG